MPIPFPSDPWIKAMMAELNASSSYSASAAHWEGDFIFVIEPGGGLDHAVILYMDLFHGKCREAYLVAEGASIDPAYRLSGSLEVWKKVMTRKLNPMQALMTGQLKLQGNMASIMRNTRAAQELVNCCTRIETEFSV